MTWGHSFWGVSLIVSTVTKISRLFLRIPLNMHPGAYFEWLLWDSYTTLILIYKTSYSLASLQPIVENSGVSHCVSHRKIYVQHGCT